MPSISINFAIAPNEQRAQRRQLFRISDGDTPVIEQPVRMVSCDTPEKAGYAGLPPLSQTKLNACLQRLQGNFYNDIPVAMRQYLIDRLRPNAAADHIAAGERATFEFDHLLETRLTRPDGTKRATAILATGEILDSYGRLLAYIAPWYSNTPADPLPPPSDPKRRTFNLDMVENGWAAFFPVYPSLQKKTDMDLIVEAAETAWNQQRGAWNEFGQLLLLGYEYRACIKLGIAETAAEGIAVAFQRACVDLRNLHIMGTFGYHNVPPPYRLWIWEKDLAEATAKLGLHP